jgi:uncharacterized membrane protein
VNSRTVLVVLVGIAVAGTAISLYLLTVHYASIPLVCTTTGVVNCEKVLSSQYSSIAGIPISAAGLLWFVVVGFLAITALVVSPEPSWIHLAQVLWSFVGLAAVLYLIGVESLALGVLCAWCTVLHILIAVTLVLSILRSPVEPRRA